MGNGYWGKVLRINLTDHSYKVEDVGEEVWKKFVGGSGFGAKIILEEVPPKVDPLSPENKLTFGVGCFQAGRPPGSAKWSVCTKSPLTKTWLDSAGAGFWAPLFKRCGYDHLIIEGKSPEPLQVYITEDDVQFLPAQDLWGLDTLETTKAIKAKLGDKVSSLVIGPAGEMQHPIACISCDGMSFAGRGGSGAVMGSKNLKAISAYGSKEVPVYDREEVDRLSRELMKELAERGADFRKHGTPKVMAPCEEMGDAPIKYWTQDTWPEGARTLSAPNYTEVLKVKPYPCANCPVGCHRWVTVEEPKEWAYRGSGPEYETIAMLGSNLLIDDLPAVCKANELCNRYGIDTISCGAWIGFLMECYEKGLLTEEELGGPVKWGDSRRMVELVEQIAKMEGIAQIFKEGIVGAAAKVGKGAEEIIVHVKNLDMPAHDPRAVFGLGVNYATCPIGASHERGNPQATALGLYYPELGWNEPPDRFDVDRAAEVAYVMQNAMIFYNCLSHCEFMVGGAGMTLTEINKIFNAITGWNYTVEDMINVGKRAITLQRLINVRDGISRKDDQLPPKMFVAAKEGGRAGKIPAPHDKILDQYYELRKWDKNGIPTPEALKELGLEEYISYIPQ